MSNFAASLLEYESKDWPDDYPVGFVAQPLMNPDGTKNVMKWQCAIPGKVGTPWEQGVYRLCLTFDDNYPLTPPQCIFEPQVFHPNVYRSGKVALPLLEPENWRADIDIKEVLIAIQDFLAKPNLEGPVAPEAYIMLCEEPEEYDKTIYEQAVKMAPTKLNESSGGNATE